MDGKTLTLNVESSAKLDARGLSHVSQLTFLRPAEHWLSALLLVFSRRKRNIAAYFSVGEEIA